MKLHATKFQKFTLLGVTIFVLDVTFSLVSNLDAISAEHVAVQIVRALVIATTAASLLLLVNSNAALFAIFVSLLIGIATAALGVYTNSMGEYYSASGIDFAYLGLTALTGFELTLAIISLAAWTIWAGRKFLSALEVGRTK